MMRTAPSPVTTGVRTTWLGVVSFLNARPLVADLENEPTVGLVPAVPAALFDLLMGGGVDVALVPVVDLWRASGRLTIVSDACIASESETLTVRVFSRMPPDRIEHLHADPDSHTSILLARILWREMYGREPALVDWMRNTPADDVEAVLLIGDKVVADSPHGYGFEVDLGGAWRHLTGLPFVFAAWAAFAGRDWSALAERLSVARDRGVARAADIASQYAAAHGWPAALARRYLVETLRYTLTASMRQGMERFHELAERHGLLPTVRTGRVS